MYASIDFPISVGLVDFQAGVENLGCALAAKFGLSLRVSYESNAYLSIWGANFDDCACLHIVINGYI